MVSTMPESLLGVLDKRRTIAGPGFNRWLVPPAALCVHLCIGMASPMLQEVCGGRLLGLDIPFEALDAAQLVRVAATAAGFTGLLSLSFMAACSRPGAWRASSARCWLTT
jgi:hypothetical protein